MADAPAHCDSCCGGGSPPLSLSPPQERTGETFEAPARKGADRQRPSRSGRRRKRPQIPSLVVQLSVAAAMIGSHLTPTAHSLGRSFRVAVRSVPPPFSPSAAAAAAKTTVYARPFPSPSAAPSSFRPARSTSTTALNCLPQPPRSFVRCRISGGSSSSSSSRYRTRASIASPSFQFPHGNHATSAIAAAAATTTRLFSTASKYELSRADLQSMKVADLRQLVKESEWHQRGLLTRLSKKQDLVDFLDRKINGFSETKLSSTPTDAVMSEFTETSPSQPQKRIRRMPSLHQSPRPLSVTPVAPVPSTTATTTATTSSDTVAAATAAIAMPAADPSTLPSASNDNTNDADMDKDPAVDQETTPKSAKDAIFEKVYQRYPPAAEEDYEVQRCQALVDGDTMADVRQAYHPILQPNGTKVSSDMDVVFVGTASCAPSTTRGVSCTAIRFNWKREAVHGVPNGSKLPPPFSGGTWLFDCGECTQLQVQRTPAVRPSKVTKIFVTHAHGDHTFGLPGLLCLMGQDRDRDSPPIDIYGPEGIRMWLRVAIRYSVSRIVPPYRVHELKDIPMAPEWQLNRRTRKYFYRGIPRLAAANQRQQPYRWPRQGLAGEDLSAWIHQANTVQLEPSPFYGEIDGGRDIYPNYDHPKSNDGAPVWDVEDEGDVKVFAAPMSHGIPCVGYVVQEVDRAGRLRDDIVRPLVVQNSDALRKAGFRVPMKAMGVIKNLPVGASFTFPDGTVIKQEDAVEPPRRGRKIVICGDTASSRALEKLAQDADVVIHEATNTHMQGVDPRDSSLREVSKDTVIHGHSTPYMAGEFAKRVNAKRLLLNHFSPRYKGDASVESMSIMLRIEYQAIKASGLSESQVAAAWDMMHLPVPMKDKKT